jgi:hypothetical protein
MKQQNTFIVAIMVIFGLQEVKSLSSVSCLNGRIPPEPSFQVLTGIHGLHQLLAKEAPTCFSEKKLEVLTRACSSILFYPRSMSN